MTAVLINTCQLYGTSNMGIALEQCIELVVKMLACG